MASSKNNIIYGGPEGPSITAKYNCFAGYFLDKLKEYNEKIILVNFINTCL